MRSKLNAENSKVIAAGTWKFHTFLWKLLWKMLEIICINISYFFFCLFLYVSGLVCSTLAAVSRIFSDRIHFLLFLSYFWCVWASRLKLFLVGSSCIQSQNLIKRSLNFQDDIFPSSRSHFEARELMHLFLSTFIQSLTLQIINGNETFYTTQSCDEKSRKLICQVKLSPHKQ